MIGWRDLWSREFLIVILGFIVGRAIYELAKWGIFLVWR
jgi:hypothetical protein